MMMMSGHLQGVVVVTVCVTITSTIITPANANSSAWLSTPPMKTS